MPYADWNLLVFPDPDQAIEKARDLTMLSDIFPTGFHGASTAGVKPGSTELLERFPGDVAERLLVGSVKREMSSVADH